jgi:tetratricopeptide (TPR) repeat protein
MSDEINAFSDFRDGNLKNGNETEKTIRNLESNISEDRDEARELTEIADLSRKGYQYLKENRLDDALDCFHRILAMDESNNYALVGLGDVTRKRGSYRDAVSYYQRCLVTHPRNNYALFGLADSYKALNQYHKAIEIWEQYLLHDDRNITVLTRVADAYRKVRDFQHSRDVYLRVLEMEYGNPYAIIGLGHLHYDFKEYRDALSYWEKMLDVNKEKVDIRVLTSIGNCHRKLKTFDQGIDYFKKALQRDPGNFYALFGLADCYRGLNQPEQALEYWGHILEQDPRNKVILTRSGDACRTLGIFDKATEFYERALNIEYDTYAVLGLAVVDKAQGKYDDAIQSLKRLIQQDPKNYRLYIELADCRLLNGEKQLAIEVLEEFQRQGIRNNSIMEFLERLRS